MWDMHRNTSSMSSSITIELHALSPVYMNKAQRGRHSASHTQQVPVPEADFLPLSNPTVLPGGLLATGN